MANPRTIARLEARIHERAANALEFEIADPRAGFITVTRVELAKDLSTGKVFYSVLGDDAEKRKVAGMLTQAAGYLQRQIGKGLQVRRVPHLTWIFDASIEEAARLDDLIGKALERDQIIASEGKAPPPEPEDWEAEYERFTGEDEPPPPSAPR